MDVHALRHTFGTMLSQYGATPRTAQSAMRHSKIDLTMNVYTDPRLLDVSGALDALPALPLNRNPDQSTESTKATGTDGDTTKKFPPMFPPGTAQSGHSESSAVTLAFRSAEDSDYE
ncbi:MAG: tyrosine-type recombinase/integrase, partial [Planctomycetota bacterium]|nr:tyrosine-type recombinase/integrase [Planctomycetota bacterium]